MVDILLIFQFGVGASSWWDELYLLEFGSGDGAHGRRDRFLNRKKQKERPAERSLPFLCLFYNSTCTLCQ